MASRCLSALVAVLLALAPGLGLAQPAPTTPLSGSEIVQCIQNHGYKQCTAQNIANVHANQPLTSTFWNPGAKIDFLADRVLAGACVTNGGNTVSPSADWLGQSGIASEANFAQFCSFTDPASPAASFGGPLVGGLFAASTVNGITGSTPRALECFGWNQATITMSAWCIYSEIWKTGPNAGQSFGWENEGIDSYSAVTNWDPYTSTGGSTIDNLLGCGGGRNPTGLFDCAVALQIAANGHKFANGIVLTAGSIAADGPGGTIKAIAMPDLYCIQWYSGPGAINAALCPDGSGNFNITGSINGKSGYQLNGNLLASPTAPTISSGFGTSPSVVVNNGTAAFTINVGTSNTGTGVIGLPAAPHGWVCMAQDITTTSATVFLTKGVPTSTASCTLQNYSDAAATHAWVDSDVLQVTATPY